MVRSLATGRELLTRLAPPVIELDDVDVCTLLLAGVPPRQPVRLGDGNGLCELVCYTDAEIARLRRFRAILKEALEDE